MHTKLVAGHGQAGSWARFAEAAGHSDLAGAIGSHAFGLLSVSMADAGLCELTEDGQLARLLDDGWLLAVEVLDDGDTEAGDEHPSNSDLDGDGAVIAYCCADQ